MSPADEPVRTSDEGRAADRGRVLISGAGVAGPALAYWLDRAGFDVTVLERAPQQRGGGQNVDIRGRAREVLALMDLDDEVRRHHTGEVGTRFVDETGDTVSEFPAGDATDGPTAELEILRSTLSSLITDACSSAVTWWFDDHIVALDQDDIAVSVDLDTAGTHTFDVVVIAEGSGSRTRDLLWRGDDAPELRRLGLYLAYATIPRLASDDQWWRWLPAADSRGVTLRPDDEGTIRATLAFLSDPIGLEDAPLAEQRRVLRERFADVGWETPRIIDAIDASDELFVEDLTQVVCPTWSHGRVCLLGDAAWCVTPLAGLGTSLAVLGAYVLAAELSDIESTTHPAAAFDAYETWMRPIVDDAQKLPPGTPRLAYPKTELGVRALRVGTRLASTRPLRAIFTKLASTGDDERPLPDSPLA